MALAFVQSACAGDERRDIPLLDPFRYLHANAIDEVTLAVSEEANVSDFCNLEAFGGLRPGLTKEEAEALLGPSSGSRLERSGNDEVHLFPRKDGVIEIVRQKAWSSDGEKSYFRWFVRFAPADTRMEHHLDSGVVNLLRVAGLGEEYSVKLFNDPVAVKFEVRDSKIERVWWQRDQFAEQSSEANSAPLADS